MQPIAFIGGGNMAAAIIGGLLEAGRPAASILVVEPQAAQREHLAARFAIETIAAATLALGAVEAVVWAIKPQVFRAAAAPCRAHVGKALQLSIMAGIRSETIAEATGASRIVRAMPNTPALIGRGIAGVFARPGIDAADRSLAESLLAPTGERVWVEREDDLDAVTALSGSGPAYAFHVLEAMLAAAHEMGLADADARRLAVQTLAGAAALAGRSDEPVELLRRNVTSPGGTTAAAMAILESHDVKSAFVAAILAARDRARQLGDEFGNQPGAAAG
jgi:pyrroline-5-carboxylate reductase